MVTSRGIRPMLLLVVAAVTSIVTVLAARLTGEATAALSPRQWAGILPLALMAVVVTLAGIMVARWRRGRATPPISPLWAARTLVLGQASALTGAALVGWYAAHGLLLLPDLDVDSQKARLWLVGAHVVAAVAVSVAGMITQRRCRIDEPPSSQDLTS